MRRALLALLFALAVAPALARDVASALDACIAQLPPGLEAGYERIAARCPELAPALAQSSWAAWLPRDWDKEGNNLSAAGLRELRVLIARESRRGPGAEVPQPAHLAAVLAALAPAPHSQRTWWERFKGWLREMLSVRESPTGPGWFARVLDALRSRAAFARILSLGALALVALLAGMMVVSELRAAGLLRLGSRPRAAADGGAVSAAAAADLAGIETASPSERPRLLLELIAARLAELERLPPARALTVRELLHAAQLADASDRARLADLAQVAEQLRFSGRTPPAGTLAAALARGRELLEGLAVAHA
jgi:uncharacterized protein DUF4129